MPAAARAAPPRWCSRAQLRHPSHATAGGRLQCRPMNLKLPKTYKTLLALAVVAGPFIWLVLTEDGQRRSDLFLLHLFGHQPFNIKLERLGPEATMPLIREQFPRLEFDCRKAGSSLGEQVCAAEIGSFNGIPARAARLWTTGGGLRALRLDYRRRYHELLVDSLTGSLGAPDRQVGGGQSVLSWRLAGGRLLLPAAVATDKDAALMWIATD